MAAGRASGKVILLGEHAVVYGAPALAAGIERGASADAKLLPDGETSRIELAGPSVTMGGATLLADPAARSDVARAFAALLAHAPPLPPVAVQANTELPPGGGLGSSAAVAVAIARAVAIAAGRAEANDETIARATAWEQVFHGNPSGIDVAAAAFGGCFRFTRVDGIRPVVPGCEIVLAIGDSGVASSTRTMVEGLAHLRARKTEMVDRSIAGITALVENAALAIAAGDLQGLGKLMDLNQMLLSGLMLSTEVLEHLCRLAREAGALGAKLTGKGGGGSVIALVDPAVGAGPVLDAWRAAGFSGFSTRVAMGETPKPPAQPVAARTTA
jgi:mevalonate kinase